MSCVKKFKFFSKNIKKTKNELGFSLIEIHVKSMIPFRDDQGCARTERLGVTKSKAQIDNGKARKTMEHILSKVCRSAQFYKNSAN